MIRTCSFIKSLYWFYRSKDIPAQRAIQMARQDWVLR